MAEFNVYKGIMQGLNEAIEFKKGKNSKSHVRILSTVDPIPVAEYKPADVARLRKGLNLSQKGLAVVIGVSPRTVESWEAGKSAPSGVATRILHLIEADNSLVDKLAIR
jgi:putative transcriptional regulator